MKKELEMCECGFIKKACAKHAEPERVSGTPEFDGSVKIKNMIIDWEFKLKEKERWYDEVKNDPDWLKFSVKAEINLIREFLRGLKQNSGLCKKNERYEII